MAAPTPTCNGESYTSPTGCGTCAVDLDNAVPYANTKQPQYDIVGSSPSLQLSATGLTPIPLRRWTQVVLVIDPGSLSDPDPNVGNSIEIYLNGALDRRISQVAKDAAGNPVKGWGLLASTMSFTIGGGSPIKGLVDEVAYYRRLLTADEIAQHYQAGISTNYLAPAALPLSERSLRLNFLTAQPGLLDSGLRFTPNSAEPAQSSFALAEPNPLKELAAWTAELWVQPAQAAGSTLLAAWDQRLPAERLARLELSAAGVPRLAVNGAQAQAAATGPLALNQWHYLALVMDGSSTKLYVRSPGQAAPQLAITNPAAASMPAASATPLFVGAHLGATVTLPDGVTQASVPSAFFDGLLDELVLHSRALSLDEMTARAESGLGAGMQWNPGLGLDRAALFFKPAALLDTSPSQHWLFYGPIRPTAPVAFCGQAVPGNCQAEGLMGAAAIAADAPILQVTPVQSNLLVTIQFAGASYSVLDTGTKPLPAITLTDTQGGAFTVLRVHLPAPLSLRWDVSGFSPASPVASAVLDPADASGKTLRVTLSRTLAAGETVTLSGLGVTNFAAAGKDHLWVDLDDPGCADAAACSEAETAAFVTVAEGLALLSPAVQVSNALSTEGALTGLSLLKFRLKAVGGPVNLSQVTVDYTAREIAAADITQAVLLPINWPGTVSSNTIAFTGPGAPLAQDQAVEYAVQADVARIGDAAQGSQGDELTLTMNATPANLAGDGGSSAGAPAAVADQCATPPCSKTHKLTGYVMAASPGSAIVGDPISVTWKGLGDFSSNVQVAFSPTGALNEAGSVMLCQTPGATPCAASGAAFSWPAADLVTTAGRFWVSGQVTIDGQAQSLSVQSKSAQTIKGALTIATPSAWPVNQQRNIAWTHRGTFPAEVFLSTNGGVSFGVSPICSAASTADQCAWTPATTVANAKVKVCGGSGTADCALSGVFPITGISVTAPKNTDPPYVIGAGGVTVPVGWSALGMSFVDAYYCTTGCGDFPAGYMKINSAALSAGGGAYAWSVPASFAALSNQVKVRVVDAGDSTSFGESQSFTIRGDLRLTQPAAGSAYTVGDTAALQWTTYGAIPQISLEYSTDGSGSSFGTARPLVDAASAPTQTIANTGSFAWKIPDDALSNNLRLRVVDAVSGHPFTAGQAGPVAVSAKFAFTSPADGVPGAERWPVGAAPPIIPALGWTTQGAGVTQVKLEYAAEPDYATWTPIAASAPNAGSFAWTVPDVLPPQPQAYSASYDPDLLVKVRITDITPGHPAATQISNAVTAHYFKVVWEVKDANNPLAYISKLEVLDSSPWAISGAAGDALLGPGSISRYYPYIGLPGVSTLWSYTGDGSNTSLSQGPADAGPVATWISDRDQTRTVLLELAASDAVTWDVKADAHYDATTTPPHADFVVWLEKSGKIIDNLLDSAYLQIFDAGTLIRSIPGPIPSPYIPDQGVLADAGSSFRFAWDLTRDDGTAVADGKSYFAKVTIYRSGRFFSTGQLLNIAVPKKILTEAAGSGGSGGGGGQAGGVTLSELQAQLQPIKDATVGPAATLAATIGGQITAAQTALEGDIAAVGGQVAAVQADTAAIKTSASSLIAKVDGVQSYLADPNAGLPKVLANQAAMQNQLKAARKGKILNRETVVEPDESVTLYYQPADPSITPLINIYGPSGLIGFGTMTLGADGLYSFQQTFGAALPLGDYSVVVAEAASAVSAGTVENIVLRLRAPSDAAQAVGDVSAQLTALSAQLSAVEAGLSGRMTAIQAAMATGSQMDAVVAAVAGLQAKWGTLTAADLQGELAAISALIGAPATGTLAGDVAAIPGAISYTARFDALDSALTDLSSQVGDPAQRADLAAVSAKLNSVESNMAKEAGVQTALAQLSMLQADMAALLAAVGTPAQADVLAQMDAKMDALQASMASLPGALDYTTRFDGIDTALANLQTSVAAITGGSGGGGGGGADLSMIQAALDALASQIGDPAQTVALNGMSTQLTAMAADMAKDTMLRNVQTAMSGLQAGVSGLAAQIGSPAQVSDLAAVDTKLETIKSEMAKETTVGTLQTAVDDLSTQVGTPAQAAAVQAVADQVTAVRDAIAALPGAINYSGQLTALDAKLSALTVAVGTPSQAAAVQAMADQVTAVRDAIAALPAPVNHTAQLAALQTDLAGLAAQVGDPSQAHALQAVADDVAALAVASGAVDYTPQLTALNDAMAALQTDLASVPRADYAADFAALQSASDAVQAAVGELATETASGSQAEEIMADIAALQAALEALSSSSAAGAASAAGDDAGVLAKLEELQEAISSAQGSAAATGFAQSAFNSASEAVTILKQLQSNLATGGAGSAQGATLLSQLGEKFNSAKTSLTVIPGNLEAEELSAQLKALAEKAQGVATDKGYQFDSLYELSETQATDVKTMRNQVEELKQLIEIQRAILEKNMNQPVMKTWFEAN